MCDVCALAIDLFRKLWGCRGLIRAFRESASSIRYIRYTRTCVLRRVLSSNKSAKKARRASLGAQIRA